MPALGTPCRGGWEVRWGAYIREVSLHARRVQVAHDDNFASLRRPDDGSACSIANPKTHDFEVCRTSLLPCLLRTVASNMAHPKPLRIFEVAFPSPAVQLASRYNRHTRPGGQLFG